MHLYIFGSVLTGTRPYSSQLGTKECISEINAVMWDKCLREKKKKGTEGRNHHGNYNIQHDDSKLTAKVSSKV